MPRVRLIHWNAAEARERAVRLRAAGHQVAHAVPVGLAFLRGLRANPPAAVVIDLGRLPSQGRDVALAIRQARPTRGVPLVFVGGEPDTVRRVRTVLPDASFTSWVAIGGALKWAIAHPPADPVAPRSLLEGYSGTPLPKKLGIKADGEVALVGAPRGFRALLGDLPEGARVRTVIAGRPDVTIWFVRSAAELRRGMAALAARAGDRRLWIAWPKKASALAADVSEREVRAAGLAVGLVDFKISAIDATWSGLLFTRRKRGRRG